MFTTAELTMTLTAIPDSDEMGAFAARAAELGLVVTGGGPDAEFKGRFAVTVTTGENRDAVEVQKAFDKLMKAAESIKG